MSTRARKLPPIEDRFQKGTSGNPKGRPRSQTFEPPSAFEIVRDRTVTVTQGGKQRVLTLEEGLQQKIFQRAIAGDRSARREVLKMIVKREKWWAARAPKPRRPELLSEEDPDNADEALLLLGIAERDAQWSDHDDDQRLLLQPWVAQAALSRRGGRKLSAEEIGEIRRCTRDWETLRWPRGSEP